MYQIVMYVHLDIKLKSEAGLKDLGQIKAVKCEMY